MEQALRGAANRTYHDAQGQMALLPNYYKWLYGSFRSHLRGQVIELGCGAGLGIGVYLSRVESVHAVDYNEQLLQIVAETYAGRPVKIVKADLLGEWSELGGLAADAVIMMDVLEHFSDDRRVLKNVRSLLKPHGRLCLKVPAQSRLFSDMDVASGHYRRYDTKDVEDMAHDLGFRIVDLRQINQLGALAYRFKRRKSTNFSKTFSHGQLRAINALLPAVAAVDRLQCINGLSVIAVLENRP